MDLVVRIRIITCDRKPNVWSGSRSERLTREANAHTETLRHIEIGIVLQFSILLPTTLSI